MLNFILIFKIEFKNIITTNNDKNVIDNDNKNSNGVVNIVKKIKIEKDILLKIQEMQIEF